METIAQKTAGVVFILLLGILAVTAVIAAKTFFLIITAFAFAVLAARKNDIGFAILAIVLFVIAIA